MLPTFDWKSLYVSVFIEEFGVAMSKHVWEGYMSVCLSVCLSRSDLVDSPFCHAITWANNFLPCVVYLLYAEKLAECCWKGFQVDTIGRFLACLAFVWRQFTSTVVIAQLHWYLINPRNDLISEASGAGLLMSPRYIYIFLLLLFFVRFRNCFCSCVGVRVHIFSYALARAG